MAESDGQERTEEATPRRLQQAREKGQVARSKELASASVLIVGAIALMWFGESLARSLFSIMSRLFDLTRDEMVVKTPAEVQMMIKDPRLVELAFSRNRTYTPAELRDLMGAIRRWGK